MRTNHMTSLLLMLLWPLAVVATTFCFYSQMFFAVTAVAFVVARCCCFAAGDLRFLSCSSVVLCVGVERVVGVALWYPRFTCVCVSSGLGLFAYSSLCVLLCFVSLYLLSLSLSFCPSSFFSRRPNQVLPHRACILSPTSLSLSHPPSFSHPLPLSHTHRHAYTRTPSL